MVQIEFAAVSKTFVVHDKAGRFRRVRREVHAVDRVSFDIASGEMIGYIGPNGAGKSTTIKMLTGILVPTSGRVRVLDLDPTRQRIDLARRIGVVFGQRTQLWWDLPLADSFELLHHVYRTPAARHRENLAGFVDLLDLGPFLATPVRQLSLGQRMRGELTAALLHDPDVVLLDEPTIGLDVVSKHAVREFLRSLNQSRGTTVLLTTHDLADVEALCERMMIIDHGRIIHDGGVEAFRRRYGRHRTLVVDLEEARPSLAISPGTVVGVEGPRQWIRFDREEVTAAEMISRVVAEVRVVDLAIEEPRIEDLVRAVYRAGRG